MFLIKPDPDKFKKVPEHRAALGQVSDPAWTFPVVANGRRYLQRLVCSDLMR